MAFGPVDIAAEQSHIYVTTDSLSASLSLCQAPTWDPRPFNYFVDVYSFVCVDVERPL
jgi:hypothetical protein